MKSYVEEGVQLARDLQKVRLHAPVPMDEVIRISKACVDLADEREKMIDSIIECISMAMLEGVEIEVKDVLRSVWSEKEILESMERVKVTIADRTARKMNLKTIDGGKE